MAASRRDLASFAIDGGALLIGLAELWEQRSWRLAPQPLDGLAERVEQIATQLVDPPLFVQVTDIPSRQDATAGYLLVEVARDPAGPDAEHACGRMYAVAQPLTAPSGAVRMLVSRSEQATGALVREVDQLVPNDQRARPDTPSASGWRATGRGGDA